MSDLSFTEDEKTRLSEGVNMQLQMACEGRANDVTQAQAMLAQAKWFTTGAVTMMMAFPWYVHYVSVIGVVMVLTMFVGTIKKYQSRMHTRLRMEILAGWRDRANYKAIYELNGRFKYIQVKESSFWSTVYCRLSIAVVYFLLVALLVAANFVDLPSASPVADVIDAVVKSKG